MQPTYDLTNCDREPIQWPGYIQSHGFLLALDPATFQIWQASENVCELTGRSIGQLTGESIANVAFGTLAGRVVSDLLTVATRDGTPDLFNPYPITINGRNGYFILHQHDGALILEWEPTAETKHDLSLSTTTLLSQMMGDIQRSDSLSNLLTRTAQRVKSLTGFDRVMIYHFGEDWNGEVIAEAREYYLESWLGLHYPASDIPRQARELYKINLVRGIVDVSKSRVPILPANYAQLNRPLDLTHAQLRAVSPLHVEYLHNMGVQASLSISLLYQGELWGLIACHHYTAPRFVDYPTRQSLKLISQLLSTTLQIRKDDEDAEFTSQLQQTGQALHQQMLGDWDVAQGLTKHQLTALDLNTASGAALLFEDQLYLLGNTPPKADIMLLIDWLQNAALKSVFQTNQLPNLFPPAEHYRDKASGLLALVLSQEMNEYLLWFKPEQIQEVSWGGNPGKTVTVNEGGEIRMSPRKSFEKWTQQERNKAQPWQQSEVAMALKLREDLLQLVSQKANQIRALNEQLRLAYEELEAFSYTVSHDLRTPLSSIKSYTEIYLEDYGHQMSDTARDIFGKVISASDRMSMLIRNIMQYSRMNNAELIVEPLTMNILLGQLREELLAAEGERAQNLCIQIGDTPDLNGDQTMITQVFSNLLSNAVKYSRHTRQSKITVQGSQNEQEVMYSVTDNGIGIDMKQAGKVFELFQRLESAAAYDGYGVGLAIVKRIIKRHRGKVWFESIPNQSTTFYVSFPKIVY